MVLSALVVKKMRMMTTSKDNGSDDSNGADRGSQNGHDHDKLISQLIVLSAQSTTGDYIRADDHNKEYHEDYKVISARTTSHEPCRKTVHIDPYIF